MSAHSFLAQPLDIVLVLDHAFISGGQAKVALDSARGLKQRGHNPIIFAAVGPPDPTLAEAGIDVICLGQNDLLGQSPLAAAWQGIWNAAAAHALARVLAKRGGGRTVVHVHGWAKALSPAIAGSIRASGLPAVYTLHEYFLFCPNGGFYDYRANHSCRRNPLSVACLSSNCDSRNYIHKLWRVGRQVAARDFAHLPEVFSDIITLSALSHDVVAPFVGAGVRLHRLANPIDAIAWGHKSEPASGEVIFVGRLSAEKGTLVYAEAAARAGLMPVFIGGGPLEQQIRNCYPRARLLGWQSFENVRAAIRSARALVFPSVWYETFGLTVHEALACGTPAVVSDGCAAREAIVHGRNGLLFKSGDVADLTEQLVALRDDALVSRMSHAAYEDYWAHPLTRDRHVDALCRIYAELIGTAGDSPRGASRGASPRSPQTLRVN